MVLTDLAYGSESILCADSRLKKKGNIVGNY
jgi:hypothetical protein